MNSLLYRNSLSIVLFAFFAASIVGQALTGWQAFNEELWHERQSPLSLAAYLGSGHFLSALFENWESEFLQMTAYVVLTIFLRQKGSPESKPLEGEEEEDADPREGRNDPRAPWPVRQGAVVRWLYANSLSIALSALFAVSFLLHLISSTRHTNDEAALYGRPTQTVAESLASSEFWYESFQNWQSEFFSIGAFIVLGIYLRQRGSPESKPVSAPHNQTGR